MASASFISHRRCLFSQRAVGQSSRHRSTSNGLQEKRTSGTSLFLCDQVEESYGIGSLERNPPRSRDRDRSNSNVPRGARSRQGFVATLPGVPRHAPARGWHARPCPACLTRRPGWVSEDETQQRGLQTCVSWKDGVSRPAPCCGAVAWLLLQRPFSCPMAIQRCRCIWRRRFGDDDTISGFRSLFNCCGRRPEACRAVVSQQPNDGVRRACRDWRRGRHDPVRWLR